jgi:hypothetical protein
MDNSQKEAEKSCITETHKHMAYACGFIAKMIDKLDIRAKDHDESKLDEPEFSIFVEYTPKLRDCTYNSDEYKGYLKGMQVALDHHYAVNRHHSEHFENGVNGMNLVDLMEMFCDWKAATLRHADGDIHRSIDQNKDRFGLSDQLVQILHNSVELLENK